jgi:hypothetical protein
MLHGLMKGLKIILKKLISSFPLFAFFPNKTQIHLYLKQYIEILIIIIWNHTSLRGCPGWTVKRRHVASSYKLFHHSSCSVLCSYRLQLVVVIRIATHIVLLQISSHIWYTLISIFDVCTPIPLWMVLKFDNAAFLNQSSLRQVTK